MTVNSQTQQYQQEKIAALYDQLVHIRPMVARHNLIFLPDLDALIESVGDYHFSISSVSSIKKPRIIDMRIQPVTIK